MANCTKCNCSKTACGCGDSFITSPAPCPSPVGCLNPEPCSEVFDAQCIIYTGAPIMCGEVVLIPTNTTIADALQLIATQLCQR